MKVKLKLGLIAIALLQVGSLCSIFLAVVGGWEDSGGTALTEEDIIRELTHHHHLNEETGDGSESPNGSSKGRRQELLWDESIPGKVVLMVVDALRVDMMTSDNFPFLLGQVKQYRNSGVLNFVVNVDSPTVTLPRVKTLVTGRSPTYLDVLKNFQTTEGPYTSTTKINQDNLIWGLRRERPETRICFFGDETWLRLFPSKEDGKTSDYFHKFEGVTSFFVKDFYEVDQNVTRNLNEIKDCEFLVLHYLGLDHIGHVYGPRARKDLIQNKLNEMDRVIQKLHAQLIDGRRSRKNLLLVTGDHGMANVGGHGGSSLEEVTTPLVAVITGGPVVNQEPLKAAIDQVDIAPTLAALWGLRIPKDSKGQLILDIIELFQSSQQLALSYQNNCEHLLNAMGESREAATYKLWWNEISKLDRPLSVKKYIELENELVSAIQGVKREKNLWSGLVSSIVVLVVCEMILLVCLISIFSKSWKGVKVSIVLVLFPPVLIYFSSSFIEEEHYLRYFLYSLVLVVYSLLCKPVDFRCFRMAAVTMLCHRLAISFNQTGDKWSHLPDLNDLVVQNKLPLFSSAVGIVLVLYVAKSCRFASKSFVTSLAILYAIQLVIVPRSDGGIDLLPFLADYHLQQIGLISIAVNFGLNFFNGYIKESFVSSLILLLTLLHRVQNIILVGLTLTQVKEICNLMRQKRQLKTETRKSKNSLISSVVIIWLAHASFFYQGNSNGLASVDVSAGYVGIGSFSSSVLIGIFIFINTYSGPMLVIVSSVVSSRMTFTDFNKKAQQNGHSELNCKTSRRKDNFNATDPLLLLLLLSNGAESIVYSFVLIVFQNHLFIWSVFVPKLLYLVTQSVMVLVVSIILLFLL